MRRVRGPLNEPRARRRPGTTDVFETPGRYLVICNTPHFSFFKMYGWVVVT